MTWRNWEWCLEFNFSLFNGLHPKISMRRKKIPVSIYSSFLPFPMLYFSIRPKNMNVMLQVRSGSYVKSLVVLILEFLTGNYNAWQSWYASKESQARPIFLCEDILIPQTLNIFGAFSISWIENGAYFWVLWKRDPKFGSTKTFSLKIHKKSVHLFP